MFRHYTEIQPLVPEGSGLGMPHAPASQTLNPLESSADTQSVPASSREENKSKPIYVWKQRDEIFKRFQQTFRNRRLVENEVYQKQINAPLLERFGFNEGKKRDWHEFLALWSKHSNGSTGPFAAYLRVWDNYVKEATQSEAWNTSQKRDKRDQDEIEYQKFLENLKLTCGEALFEIFKVLIYMLDVATGQAAQDWMPRGRVLAKEIRAAFPTRNKKGQVDIDISNKLRNLYNSKYSLYALEYGRHLDETQREAQHLLQKWWDVMAEGMRFADKLSELDVDI